MTWWKWSYRRARSFNANAAQAGYPRLTVLMPAEGVDGGPPAAMTMKTRRNLPAVCCTLPMDDTPARQPGLLATLNTVP
jgi:hypothetical protein